MTLPLAIAAPLLAVDLGVLKEIALVIFFGFWVALVLWLIASPASRFRHVARLPLEDDPLPSSRTDRP